MALQTVTSTIAIKRLAAEVFAWFATHKNMDNVLPGIKHRTVTPATGDNPDGAGSVRRITPAPLMPSFLETVAMSDAPDAASGKEGRIEYYISQGSVLKDHRGILTFNEQNGTTTVTYTIRFAGKIPFTGKLIALSLNQQMKMGMKKTKRLLESAHRR